MLEILDLEQGSPDWLKMREGKRTASTSPDVLGVGFNGKNGPDVVYRRIVFGEKTEVYAPAVNYGNEHEDIALESLKKEHGIFGTKPVGVRGDYLASLDCYSIDGVIVDVKCPFTKERSTTWKMAQEGKIEDKYAIQLEHQMYVFDEPCAYLYVWVPNQQPILVKKERDLALWQKIHDAWERLYQRIRNEGNEGTPEFIASANRYVELVRKKQALDEEIEALKSIMTASGGGKTPYLTASQINRKGSVSYKKVWDALGSKDVDLTPFTSQETTYWKFDIKE